jgi:hypothetical protein
MKAIFISTLLILFSFSSCINKASVSPSKISQKAVAVKDEQLPASPYLDTSITLTAANKSRNVNITNGDAKRFLYKHFESKGVRSRADFNAGSGLQQEKMCVEYDTIYNVTSPRFTGAIISYWLGVCDLNGHCFQPSKAIIYKTLKGYKLSDENFIPTNFIIDSAANSFVYGYDYECGRRGIVRQCKIRLR